MVGLETALTVAQLFTSQIRKLLSLLLRGWNRFRANFVASDMEAAVIDRSTGDDRTPFTTVSAGRKPTASIADGTTDGAQVELERGSKELLWISIVYDGPLAFDSLRWWVKFPDGYRVLREEDAESEALPDLAETSHHDGDDVLINPDGDPTYDNLARSPTDDKQFYVIERNMIRWDLDGYATGQEAIAPIWVDTAETDAGGHVVEIEIDPPSTPISINQSVEVDLR